MKLDREEEYAKDKVLRGLKIPLMMSTTNDECIGRDSFYF